MIQFRIMNQTMDFYFKTKLNHLIYVLILIQTDLIGTSSHIWKSIKY